MTPEKQYRTVAVDLQRADSKSRVFPASLSSELPYARMFGLEVLVHTAEAVDLSRARNGLPLLMHHDPQRPVGMVENVRIGGQRLLADVRFFSTDDGNEALTMAREGLRNLSVGYTVDQMEQVASRDDMAVFHVTRWTPIEASVVAIPADPTVGLNRSGRTTLTLKSKGNFMTQNTEADRVKNIVLTGAQYAKYLQLNDVADAVERGVTEEQFRETIMTRMQSGHTDTSTRVIGMSDREIQRYSLGKAIAASITGDWRDAGLEREASRTLEKNLGRAPEGFYVPSDYWRRDFNVGTGSEAGNLVATDLRTDLYVDALRNALVMGALGVRILPGLTSNIDIPRKLTPSTLGMLTEIQASSETNPATAKISLTPKRVAAYVEYSKQALLQASMSVESMLRDDLLQGAAVLIEDQMINGSGAGANARGIRNTSGIGSVVAGTNGLTVAWSHFTDLEAACANVNASPGAIAGYLANTKTRAKAKNVQRGTNLDFIISPDAQPGADGLTRVNGYRVAYSNNMPSNLTKGTSTTICSAALFASDWSMAVLALFGAPDITVDPYSLATTGQVRITLNQFFDFGVRQPGAFSKIEDLLTT